MSQAKNDNVESPATAYTTRLRALSALQTKEQRLERSLGIAKLAIAALTLTIAVLLIHRGAALSLLLIPVIAFVVCAIRQEQILRAIRYRKRTLQFYERGLARLNGTWASGGETGERFLDPRHPYARDLDIFGAASLYEYLCTARTRGGEKTLADWLLAPAPIDEVVARQAAVVDLKERLEFRERLFAAGESVRNAMHPEALAAWGERDPILTSATTRVATLLLAALWIGGLVAWAVWGNLLLALAITVLNFAYAHQIHARLESTANSVERASDELKLLARILALVEREGFSTPKLVALQSALRHDAMTASLAIKQLASMADLLAARHSMFAKPLDLVTFWSAHVAFRVERWQQTHGPAIRRWIESVGEFEALAALSTFAYEHPEYVFPRLVQGTPSFEAGALAHPLLPADKAVDNDVRLDGSAQLMILSGPNMAGKSTFIRSIGVNAVLAQCGAPVRARKLTMSQLMVAASICILDSLSGGISRFYAEIHRVKHIADLAEGSVPVLFLLDELLSGTNSHDRVIGTEYVLESLLERNAIGVVSTHDLALTEIPARLGRGAFNCHFEDQIEGEALVFDYKLKPGVVQTSNALKLMRSIGLNVTSKS